MQCSCEREALLRVLTVGTNLCRAFPDLFQVTFAARATGETTIDIFAWHEASGVGVWATIPADVREAGVIMVPTRMTTDVLATQPGNRISLTLVQLPDRERGAANNDLVTPLLGGPALQIESIGNTGRRQRTRLRLVYPIAEQTMESALATFRLRGVPLANLSPRALREAWKPCLLLAKKRVEAADDTLDVDHALVLLRFDPAALVCTATTRNAIAQSRLPWTPLETHVPVSHVLVDEHLLRWISNALKQETQPVTLTLVPQIDSPTLLFVTCSQVTLLCRATTAPIPLVWERRVHAPGSQVLILSRLLFAKSLDFLAADRAHGADRCLLLRVEDRQLCLQWDPLAQEDHVVTCEIPLANTVQRRAPVLVHLHSLREMLRQFKEPVVCLEQGDIRLRKRADTPEDPVLIGFVRLSQPIEKTIQIMMTISERISSPSTASTPAGPASEPPTTEMKGDAFATI